MNISRKIGIPATLEGCAEECAELSQACLKVARKLRNENPTPVNCDELYRALHEEVADVLVCIDTILEAGIISHETIESIMTYKKGRWEKRIMLNDAERRKAND